MTERQKISLTQQLDEVRRELDQRKRVYPHLVASRKMRQSIADYQTLRMEAVGDTLLWLIENEQRIKETLAGEIR